MSIFGRNRLPGAGVGTKINCKWAELIDTLIIGMIENALQLDYGEMHNSVNLLNSFNCTLKLSEVFGT